MTRMIKETIERQNHDFSSSIISGKKDEESFSETGDSENG
jgi:hypothetical protein